MSKYQIAVIVGSLRKDSFNRKLATALAKLAPNGQFTFKQVDISDLPLYNQDDDGSPANAVTRLEERNSSCTRASLCHPRVQPFDSRCTEECHRSRITPVWPKRRVVNPLACASGASIGAMGTALAQQHLRNILAYLDVPTLGQPEAFIQAKDGLFDESGNIGPASKQFLQGWMDRYAAWVKKHVG